MNTYLVMMTPIEIVAEYWYVVPMFLPFISAFIVKNDASGGMKRLVSFALAAVVGVATLASADWVDVSADVLVSRFVGVWAIGQAVYHAVNKALVTGNGKELNEVTFPEFGVK